MSCYEIVWWRVTYNARREGAIGILSAITVEVSAPFGSDVNAIFGYAREELRRQGYEPHSPVNPPQML